jgi:hypothetical protein
MRSLKGDEQAQQPSQAVSCHSSRGDWLAGSGQDDAPAGDYVSQISHWQP